VLRPPHTSRFLRGRTGSGGEEGEGGAGMRELQGAVSASPRRKASALLLSCGVPEGAQAKVAEPEASDGCRLPAQPGCGPEVVVREEPRLLERIPQEEPRCGGAEPRATARAEPAAARNPAEACWACRQRGGTCPAAVDHSGTLPVDPGGQRRRAADCKDGRAIRRTGCDSRTCACASRLIAKMDELHGEVVVVAGT
jgi:hypothetical protein